MSSVHKLRWHITSSSAEETKNYAFPACISSDGTVSHRDVKEKWMKKGWKGERNGERLRELRYTCTLAAGTLAQMAHFLYFNKSSYDMRMPSVHMRMSCVHMRMRRVH